MACSRIFWMAPLLLFGAAVRAADYPDVTVEGLPRVASERLDAVYWRPGVTLSGYDRFMLEPCEVAFRRNWQRDQNTNRGNFRVTADDMARIRSDLADVFETAFVRELAEEGNYPLVEDAAEGVLLLRPKIIDLDVFAPDLLVPNRIVTLTMEAGRMTLQMDLIDAASGQLIGRVIDRRRARMNQPLMVTNRVTNRAEADRIISSWARILRRALDDVRGTAGNEEAAVVAPPRLE